MKTAVAYLRVSTQSQKDSGGGIEAQRDAIARFSAAKGYDVVEYAEEAASGAMDLDERPVLKAVLAKAAKIGAIVIVSKLDRLSRKVSFIARLMDAKVKFAVTELGGEEVDPFILQVMAALAQKEREMISQRTSAALQAMKARGVKLGNPRKYDQRMEDGSVKMGAENARKLAAAANASKADDFALKLRPTVERMELAGMTVTQIANELNANGTKTARGGLWAATTVRNLTKRWK